MIGGLIGEIVAKVALAIFSEWAKQRAIRGDERGKIAAEAAGRAADAWGWKDRHPLDPRDPGFRVRDGADRLR